MKKKDDREDHGMKGTWKKRGMIAICALALAAALLTGCGKSDRSGGSGQGEIGAQSHTAEALLKSAGLKTPSEVMGLTILYDQKDGSAAYRIGEESDSDAVKAQYAEYLTAECGEPTASDTWEKDGVMIYMTTSVYVPESKGGEDGQLPEMYTTIALSVWESK